MVTISDPNDVIGEELNEVKWMTVDSQKHYYLIIKKSEKLAISGLATEMLTTFAKKFHMWSNS